MKIRIYQISLSRAPAGCCFQTLENLCEVTGSSEVNSGMYDEVYCGAVNCDCLDALPSLFRRMYPEDYYGLSVRTSDVVEVLESPISRPGFYYCDGHIFREISFHPEETGGMAPAGERLTGILLEPGCLAREIRISASEAMLRRAVGGSMRISHPFEPGICLVENPDRESVGLLPNRAVCSEPSRTDLSYEELKRLLWDMSAAGVRSFGLNIVFTADSFDRPLPESFRTFRICNDCERFRSAGDTGAIYGASPQHPREEIRLDWYMAEEGGERGSWKIERCYAEECEPKILRVLTGPCLICGFRDGTVTGLSEDQLKRYLDRYLFPEQFRMVNGALTGVPYDPRICEQHCFL